MTVLALGGPLVVIRQWLERVAVWLVIGSTLWLSFVVLTDPAFPARFADPSTARPGSVGLALDLVIALPISWWPLVADYNRFGGRPRESFGGTFVGYTLSNSWFFFLGAAILVVFGLSGQSSGPVAFVRAIVGTPLGALVLLLIVVDETDNAFANVYSTAVSAQNIAPRARQRTLILAVALASFVAGSILATVWQSFASVYEGFLLFIGGVFVPLLGVLVADQLVRRTYDVAEFRDAAPGIRPYAIVAWGAGIAAYYVIRLLPDLSISPIGASIPSFAISALLHGVAYRLTRPAAQRPST
ncbi:MAG: cytosine permease [Methanobacteriota archaeon]